MIGRGEICLCCVAAKVWRSSLRQDNSTNKQKKQTDMTATLGVQLRQGDAVQGCGEGRKQV